jgi:hypothetical protein
VARRLFLKDGMLMVGMMIDCGCICDDGVLLTICGLASDGVGRLSVAQGAVDHRTIAGLPCNSHAHADS